MYYKIQPINLALTQRPRLQWGPRGGARWRWPGRAHAVTPSPAARLAPPTAGGPDPPVYRPHHHHLHTNQ